MGALHEGHFSLIRRARQECSKVAVSIFVNPLQFNEQGDLARYPRTLESDLDALESLGVDAVLVPEASEVHPSPIHFLVALRNWPSVMEHGARPGHFDGVATVVLKLLILVGRARAYFGKKDYEQLLVVTRLAEEFHLPVEIIGVETVREPDGLALSSRNRLLSDDAREKAPEIAATLKRAAREILDRTQIDRAVSDARARLEAYGFDVDYLIAAETPSLEQSRDLTASTRLFVAATIAGVRLIDNLAISEMEEE
jgi:pantoate--beta-alanine ligase